MMSDQSFVVFERAFEDPMRNLRKINIPNQSVKSLYQRSFQNFAFNPTDQSFILNMSEGAFFGGYDDLPDGLYRLSPEGNSLTPFILGSYLSIYWEPSLDVFVARREVNNEYQRVLLDTQGEIISQFVGDAYEFYPSPDGNWMILESSIGDKLFRRDGELIKEIGEGDITWFPDSLGFFRVRTNCRSTIGPLYVHTQASSWEPKQLVENVFGCSLVLVEP